MNDHGGTEEDKITVMIDQHHHLNNRCDHDG